MHMENFIWIEVAERPPREGDIEAKTQRMRKTTLCES